MSRIVKRLLDFLENLSACNPSFLKKVRFIAKYREIVSVCEPNAPIQKKLHTEGTHQATPCQIRWPGQPGARNLCTPVLRNSITSLAGKYSIQAKQKPCPNNGSRPTSESGCLSDVCLIKLLIRKYQSWPT
jgi:hypothetical protein